MGKMKIGLILAALILTSCSVIIPRKHDPVLFGMLVDIKVSINELECGENPQAWKAAQHQIQKLKVYTELRKDPQAEAVSKLYDAIKKAGDSQSVRFCQSVLKLNETRANVIADAWRGR